MKFKDKLSLLVKNKSDLARRVGVAQSAVHEWIKGKRRPYMDQGWAIARALGVSLDYLADDTQDEPPKPEIDEEEMELLKLVRLLGVKEALSRLLQAPKEPAQQPPKRETWRHVAVE